MRGGAVAKALKHPDVTPQALDPINSYGRYETSDHINDACRAAFNIAGHDAVVGASDEPLPSPS
jgi:hypothetical protein